MPELAVTDFPRSRRFYCDVLGWTCSYAREDEGFGYLTLGAAALMIDQIGVGRDFGPLPESYTFGRGLNLQIEVPQVAPLLAALEAEGHPLVLAPEDRWYRRGAEEVGQRQFVAADPDGYLLRFCEPLGTRLV